MKLVQLAKGIFSGAPTSGSPQKTRIQQNSVNVDGVDGSFSIIPEVYEAE